MAQQQRAAVILAAGKGTRMKSRLPKVMHRLLGQPLLHYPLQRAEEVGCDPQVLVVGHGRESVAAACSQPSVRLAEQKDQLGTGHALLCAASSLEDFSGTLLLLCGDVPLLRRETLEALLVQHDQAGAAVTVLTAEVENPHGYGRIVREGEDVACIVEEKDADATQKAIREINTGIYAFSAPWVFSALEGVGRDNAQGEYYLTDVVALARKEGKRVCAVVMDAPCEAMGINDRGQLAEASALLRQRVSQQLMRDGVTLIDPATTYVDTTVSISPDTVLHPGVHIHGRTSIGRDCEIGPGVTIRDCQIGERVHIKSGSVLQESRVGDATDIGPMAHLRPGTVLAGENKIGNFVETKKAQIGFGSKASHLTYIGDAEIGAEVNIGCGTITCNYDGVNKYKTVIEDHVFVGSDTQFVAPVRIGRGSLIGAGSTITRDVPPDALALSRSEQKVVEGWAKRKKRSKKSSS
ncbi:MAG: bifunctional UDP-N-acetylglucosamine diphosphorylase/glucosamine-1-phosphate N-acetyltransferase GlmU [Desulfuromonas sp.]|nr:MAG: bifunctional UDP-N-acetylglucosamine diphosphorylase/glucosamine-1-phosphate N-acetyltransferase GlmU [Desulfuromonas sp.]